jgi:hypothetical protein
MATTVKYEVVCPSCRVHGDVDLELFDTDPQCETCGRELGKLVRVEGFREQEARTECRYCFPDKGHGGPKRWEP